MTRSRTSLLLATTALLGLSALSACGTDSSSEASAEPDRTVAAAFYPLAWVTEQVAGDEWTVENLTSSGTDPHDLELSINQTVLISDAALVVHEQGLQPAVDTAIEENSSGTVIDVASIVDLRGADESSDEHEAHAHEDEADDEHAHDEADEHDAQHAHEDEAHEDEHAHEDEADDEHAHEDEAHEDHDHDHGDTDPHFWLDPVRLAKVGDAVAAELSELNPDGAEEYQQNAADLRAQLEELDSEFTDGLAQCERTDVVVGHDAFGYLDKYGLELHPILGLSPDAEPSAATLRELEQVIEENKITTVFTETLASPKAAEALARDAGVETAVLDPLEGLSEATADQDYLSLSRANLAALQEANGC